MKVFDKRVAEKAMTEEAIARGKSWRRVMRLIHGQPNHHDPEILRLRGIAFGGRIIIRSKNRKRYLEASIHLEGRMISTIDGGASWWSNGEKISDVETLKAASRRTKTAYIRGQGDFPVSIKSPSDNWGAKFKKRAPARKPYTMALPSRCA